MYINTVTGVLYHLQCASCGYHYTVVTQDSYIPFVVIDDEYVCKDCYEEGNW